MSIVFINYFLFREKREISGDQMSVGKNSSAHAAAPTTDNVFVGIRVCLGRLYESEDAVLKYGRERRVVFEKEIKVKHENFLRIII